MEPSATSTTVTGPFGERVQTGTEDSPVIVRPATLRRLDDSGAGYKYPDLLTYLLYTIYADSPQADNATALAEFSLSESSSLFLFS